jgi:RNA polymerase sigma factor (sigma-70 family)
MRQWTDPQLVEAIAEGREPRRSQALEQVFHLIAGPVRHLVLSHRGSAEDAEEVLQDTLLAFDSNVRQQQYRGQASVSSYCQQIARRKWYRRFRQRHPTEELPPEIRLDDTLPEIESQIFDHELERLVLQVLHLLDPRCRDMLKQYQLSSDMAEMAQLFDFNSIQAAKNQTQRCKEYFQRAVKNNPELLRLLELHYRP